AFRTGVDLGVWCLSYDATFVLWAQGYPDQGLRRAYEALTLAQTLSHPHSPRERAGIPALVSAGVPLAGLGTGRTGTGRRGDCPAPAGPGSVQGRGGKARAVLAASPARRGLWEGRSGRSRVADARGGVGPGRPDAGTIL